MNARLGRDRRALREQVAAIVWDAQWNDGIDEADPAHTSLEYADEYPAEFGVDTARVRQAADRILDRLDRLGALRVEGGADAA